MSPTNNHTILLTLHSCLCVSGSRVPGLQWFKGRSILHYSSLPSVTLVSSPPSTTTFFSSRVGNVCYFVTPEGVTSSTLVSSPGSLWLSPVHPHGSYREATASTKNPQDDAHLYAALIHSAAVLNFPHGMHCPHRRTPTASGRSEREMATTVCLNIPNWSHLHSSCWQVFENRHSVTMWQTSERLLFYIIILF